MGCAVRRWERSGTRTNWQALYEAVSMAAGPGVPPTPSDESGVLRGVALAWQHAGLRFVLRLGAVMLDAQALMVAAGVPLGDGQAPCLTL